VTTANREYLIYADGSCLGNPGPGGWGVVLKDPGGVVREFNGSASKTTNNRMELTGAIEGLRATEPGANVVLRSDSQYVINTMTKNWKRNKNQDLWEMLDKESQIRNVKFEWVRGHDVDPINNRADVLAVIGAKGKLIAEESSHELHDALSRPTPIPQPSPGQDISCFDEVDAEVAKLIAPTLTEKEQLRKCCVCGCLFVSTRKNEEYCSHAACQLARRR
jgi:ribonuclease HI